MGVTVVLDRARLVLLLIPSLSTYDVHAQVEISTSENIPNLFIAADDDCCPSQSLLNASESCTLIDILEPTISMEVDSPCTCQGKHDVLEAHKEAIKLDLPKYRPRFAQNSIAQFMIIHGTCMHTK